MKSMASRAFKGQTLLLSTSNNYYKTLCIGWCKINRYETKNGGLACTCMEFTKTKNSPNTSMLPTGVFFLGGGGGE